MYLYDDITIFQSHAWFICNHSSQYWILYYKNERGTMNSKFLYYASGVLSGTIDFQDPAQEKTADFNQMYPVWNSGGGQVWLEDEVRLGGRIYRYHTDLGRGRIYADMESPVTVDVAVCNGYLCGFLFPGRNESRTYVLEGYEDCTNLICWSDPLISPCTRQVKEPFTVMIPMRDGIRLATDIFLPTGNEKETYPSILIRTCYNKNSNEALWARYAARGYAVIVQDCRGREASEGEWIPFIHEMADGDDTINWIAAQSWSDGGVGMLGGSYLGYVQWAAAASGNPHLKALVSQVTAGSPFVDLPKRGGCLESGVLAWSFMVADRITNDEACVRDDWDSLLRHRPIGDIPSKALGKRIPFFDEWMKHPDNDEFWKKAAWEDHADSIDIPALYISGWFDDDGPGTTMAWEMNQKRGRSHQRMILGPWLHKTNSTRKVHTLELPPNALRYDLDALYVRWFDRFLKGVENQVDDGPAVEYYMLGEGEWKEDSQWPPKAAVMTPFYFSSAADCTAGGSEAETYGLRRSPEETQTSLSYHFDPADPFPYVIDVSENECAVPGDYTEAEKRSDVLLFTSPYLTDPVSIAGDVIAVLKATSSCPDTDWIVRLTDVGPAKDDSGSGSTEHAVRSIKLSDGLLRARYRRSFEKPELLVPGEPAYFEIRMTRIAHTFKKGHRIRIQITSGADNLCFANSNTGGDEALAVELIPADQSIYTGGTDGSFVKLPVLAVTGSNTPQQAMGQQI